MNRLSSLINFLNPGVHETDEHLRTEIVADLGPLITLPDALLLKGQEMKINAATKGAWLQSYREQLEQLTEKINALLGLKLTVKLGASKLLAYRSGPKKPLMYFPLESEIAWLGKRSKEITNPWLRAHTKKGQGVINSPWGKLLVYVKGRTPNPTLKKSQRLCFYSIIAASLMNGKSFSKLRMCRHCKKIFLTPDRRRAFCNQGCGKKWNDRLYLKVHRVSTRDKFKQRAFKKVSILRTLLQAKSPADPVRWINEIPQLRDIRNTTTESQWDYFTTALCCLTEGKSLEAIFKDLPVGLLRKICLVSFG